MQHSSDAGKTLWEHCKRVVAAMPPMTSGEIAAAGLVLRRISHRTRTGQGTRRGAPSCVVPVLCQRVGVSGVSGPGRTPALRPPVPPFAVFVFSPSGLNGSM